VVRALAVAGYRVYAVNPRQAARHRELLSLSGTKSDQADAFPRTARRMSSPAATEPAS